MGGNALKNLSVFLLLLLVLLMLYFPFRLSVFIFYNVWLFLYFPNVFCNIFKCCIVFLLAAPHELTFLIISQNYSFSANLANELKNNILHQLRIEAFLNNNEVSCNKN